MTKTLKQLRNELLSEDRRLTRRINESREEVMKLEKVLDRHIDRRNDVRQTINVYKKMMSEYGCMPEFEYEKED